MVLALAHWWYTHGGKIISVTQVHRRCKYLCLNGRCCSVVRILSWSAVKIILVREFRNLDPLAGIASKYSCVALNKYCKAFPLLLRVSYFVFKWRLEMLVFLNICLLLAAQALVVAWGSSVFDAACRSLNYSMQTLSCGMWDPVCWPRFDPRLPLHWEHSLSQWTTCKSLKTFIFL